MENKKEVLTDMEEAKELFEYEMTAVLLNFKNEVDEIGKDVNTEYIEMEIDKPELEYKAPEIELSGIAYEQAEIKNSLNEVSLSAGEIGIELSSDVSSPEVSVKTDVGKPEVDKEAFKASAVSVPAALEIPKVGDVQKQYVTDIAVAVELPKISVPVGLDDVRSAVEAPSVSVPDTDISQQAFELPQAEKPQADIKGTEVSAISREMFGISPAEKVELSITPISVTETDIKVPELPKNDISMPKYPEVPEKPDFSAYYEDILTAVGKEA